VQLLLSSAPIGDLAVLYSCTFFSVLFIAPVTPLLQ
jgi:hypothetical protein